MQKLIVILATILLLHLLSDSQTNQIDSIAVLPLNNLSNNPDEEYLVDGITEAIISELSKISALDISSNLFIFTAYCIENYDYDHILVVRL